MVFKKFRFLKGNLCVCAYKMSNYPISDLFEIQSLNRAIMLLCFVSKNNKLR